MKQLFLILLSALLSLNLSAQVESSGGPKFKVILNREEQGPFNLEKMKQLIQSGQVQRNTQVLQEGYSSWTEAEQIPELNELFKSVAPQQANPADTVKVQTGKKEVVKNAYYYKKKAKVNRAIGASFTSAAILGFATISGLTGDTYTVALYIYSGLAAIGITELIIGISQNSKAKKLAEQEKKITITPSSTGIGLAIHF
jgi:hypothetical protein